MIVAGHQSSAYAAAQLTSPRGSRMVGARFAGEVTVEVVSKVSLKLAGGGGFSGLRAAASIAVLAGAVISVGFLVRATGRNPSQLLVVLMAIWVVSPFVALLWANFVSKRWSAPVPAVAVRGDAARFVGLSNYLQR